MRIYAILFALTLILCQSCATQTLWNQVHPTSGKIWYDADDIGEQELIDRGVEYCKYTNPQRGEGYWVQKTCFEQARDWTIICVATPAAIVVDGIAIAAYAVVTNPEILRIILESM